MNQEVYTKLYRLTGSSLIGLLWCCHIALPADYQWEKQILMTDSKLVSTLILCLNYLSHGWIALEISHLFNVNQQSDVRIHFTS